MVEGIRYLEHSLCPWLHIRLCRRIGKSNILHLAYLRRGARAVCRVRSVHATSFMSVLVVVHLVHLVDHRNPAHQRKEKRPRTNAVCSGRKKEDFEMGQTAPTATQSKRSKKPSLELDPGGGLVHACKEDPILHISIRRMYRHTPTQ